MGLEQHDSDGIIWGLHAMVRTPELEKWSLQRLRATWEGVRAYAEEVGGLLSWTTANYAHPTQDVFRSYGKDNVQKLRDAAAKYDPDGVFQVLCKGGFKISKTRLDGEE